MPLDFVSFDLLTTTANNNLSKQTPPDNHNTTNFDSTTTTSHHSTLISAISNPPPRHLLRRITDYLHHPRLPGANEAPLYRSHAAVCIESGEAHRHFPVTQRHVHHCSGIRSGFLFEL
ncbi:unnamed protein product [Vicia faba]|uniref:Uncharacterized protein n=1 Tax=Vicia faba TaxID=3906 RepID=A0AAV0YPJ2_VICFA|nr:unnamed protein product [Vicia faba]